MTQNIIDPPIVYSNPRWDEGMADIGEIKTALDYAESVEITDSTHYIDSEQLNVKDHSDQLMPLERRTIKDSSGKTRMFKPVKINQREGIRKLEASGFDPIEAMLATYKDIARNLEQMRAAPRRSHVAEATMFANLLRISETLAKYGYLTAKEVNDDTGGSGDGFSGIIIESE